MNCTCGKPGTVKLSYTQLWYCKSCFTRLIRHRVQKDLRQKKWFKGHDTVYLLNDGSKEHFIARKLLETIFEHRMKVHSVKTFSKVRGKKIRPSNLDREVTRKFERFLTEEKPAKDTAFHFPSAVLEEEMVQLCHLLGYKKVKKDRRHPLLEAMEKRYPGTLFGLYRSFHELT